MVGSAIYVFVLFKFSQCLAFLESSLLLTIYLSLARMCVHVCVCLPTQPCHRHKIVFLLFLPALFGYTCRPLSSLNFKAKFVTKIKYLAISM